MWALYLAGDLVLASADHDFLVEYLNTYEPGRYRAEIVRVEDPRLVAALTPVQAPSGSLA